MSKRDVFELHVIFGVVLHKALELLDISIVRYYTCGPDRIPIIVIQGIERQPYIFYAGRNFCPCYFFKYNVKQHRTYFTCKHNLACRLAIALKKEQIIEIPLTKYKKLLTEIEKRVETNNDV